MNGPADPRLAAEAHAAGDPGREERLSRDRSLTMWIYAFYGAALVFGVSAIVAIIMNYIKREDVRGSFLESHFRWQIRTFWWTMLWGTIGGITALILVGWLILGVLFIWYVYRIVKGILRLNDGRAMYAP